MPRLKSWLISGVSSGWRVTAPPVNRGLLASCSGISLGLSTFMMGSSCRLWSSHSLLGKCTSIRMSSPRGGWEARLRLGQPVYHRQHGTDTLEKMAQAQVFVGRMLVVVVIRQRHADQWHTECLRQVMQGQTPSHGGEDDRGLSLTHGGTEVVHCGHDFLHLGMCHRDLVGFIAVNQLYLRPGTALPHVHDEKAAKSVHKNNRHKQKIEEDSK